jgi:multiple sugar transport system permease protein
MKAKTKKNLISYLMLSPVLVFFIIFVYYPIIMSAIGSFFDWTILGKFEFIGFNNYKELFQSSLFRKSLSNTLYYVIFSVSISTVLAFFLAFLLNRIPKFNSFFRTTYFVPVVTSLVAISIVWKWIFEPRVGILNYFLSLFNIPSKAWLLNEKLAMPSVILMSIWKNTGFYMIIFLTGLKGISRDYYEAAEIDGASTWQQIRFITLPLLTPITFFVLTMNMLRAWQVFPEIFVMTQGGPVDATRVVVFDIWEYAFQYLRLGYGSAASYVLFIIILVITFIQNKAMKVKEYEGV